MASNPELPKTHRALVLTSFEQPPEVKEIPTPQPTSGSAVVRVAAAGILSYSKYIYNGSRGYSFPQPAVIGTSAIGRVAAVGPDSVHLQPGQLVFVDSFIKARDDPASGMLFGIHSGHSEKSKKLMSQEWRDATYAEYARVPLENCFPLNEEILIKKFGYEINQLQDVSRFAVPYGGLRDIDLKPGETIAISPANGTFGVAAVKVALAMGARVIALGRNADALQQLAARFERVEWVQNTGDVQADAAALKAKGTIDAFFDISPSEAAESTHFKSCIMALRKGGRVSLMGGLAGKSVSLPIGALVSKDLQLRGKWMYERQDVLDLIKLVEIGLLKLGGQRIDTFSLDEWEKGFEAGTKLPGANASALIIP